MIHADCTRRLCRGVESSNLARTAALARNLEFDAGRLSDKIRKIMMITEKVPVQAVLDKYGVMDYLDVKTKGTLRRWISKKGFPEGYWLGNKRVWYRHEIDTWVQSRPFTGRDAARFRKKMGHNVADDTGETSPEKPWYQSGEADESETPGAGEPSED